VKQSDCKIKDMSSHTIIWYTWIIVKKKNNHRNGMLKQGSKARRRDSPR